MKVSSELSDEARREAAPAPQGTHGSGIYPAGGVREELTRPSSVATSTDDSNRTPASNAQKPRSRMLVRADLRALSVLAVLALHLVWHTSATGLLLSLSPLSLLIGRDISGKWAMRAAVAWLLFAAVEWLYPTGAAGGEIRRLVSIAVLGVVLWRVHRARAALHELMRRDPLTGLLNRRGFDETATRELRRAARYARPLAFALIDIDRFKQVNDRFGHGFGDRVLQIVSAELGDLRGSDLAVRLGGDEFGVLMPETDYIGAELLLKRVQQRVMDRTAERGWPVTLSVGIVSLETLERVPSIEAILAEADRRMYSMKGAEHATFDADVVRAQRG